MVDAATGENESYSVKPSIPLTPSMAERVEKARAIYARRNGMEGMTRTAVLRAILLKSVDSIIEEEEGGLPLGSSTK